MSFNDIFSSNFLENVTSVSIVDVVIALILAFGIGVFVYLVHRKTYKGVMYSSGFGVTLIALCLITTFVMLAITSNVVLSLGMVGALSIVRFRTAVKDPLDIAFVFWSIAAGIVLAAGMIPLALIGSVTIGIILLVFINRKPNELPYIVVVNCINREAEAVVKKYITENVTKSIIKNKTVSKDGIELNIEVRLKNEDTDFINHVVEMNDVNHAVLVSYNGEFMN
ncbi:DUF4956 domain-containing protein [Acetobacterium woodii]|uniref:DUF4956 domain-containing protein n=1 Tax=Acetobacterium woodii (strain ATCC 29683 / DSM 1030 / JCM 2381 / KCTC 1655 / WB1) TaxID=931626 RepID=H6LF21_ACEWD|nr:DUF4956 domain-containing protein [Acetobacterium woodii]AFA46927.1 hypothetical protein Awo_c01170 [Acetobacterium woodii DSM 1030]